MNSTSTTEKISVLGTLFASLALTGATIYFLYSLGYVVLARKFPPLNAMINFIFYHLGHSVFFFCLAITAFMICIFRLNRLLYASEPNETAIMHQYALSSLFVSIVLFIGVAFTALGLESALEASIGSLNGGQEEAAKLGAWQIMNNLINGGLIVALSTTVAGGVLGYGTRLFRTLFIPGAKLTQFFIDRENKKHREVLESQAKNQKILWEILKILKGVQNITH